MPRKLKMLIGGNWVGGVDSIKVHNKYSGEILGTVPKAAKEDVERAIVSAVRAFAEMSVMPAHQRAKILEKTSALLAKYKTEIAKTIAQEAGKAWKYAVGEVGRAVQTFKFAAEEAKQIHGETIPMDAGEGSENRMGFYLRVPIGVIGAISPFNFPLNLVAHKVAPAIAAGNTVVLKPATSTPLTALRLGEIMMEAGLPNGALNIVIGSGSTVGEWLVTDPRPVKISFTGSPPIGRRIKSLSGMKRVTLELGNNSATIIDQDADLDLAVKQCVVGSFANSGQICISVQRIYVHEKIFNEFTQSFVEATEKQVVGDPMREDCDVGPMIDEGEAIRAESWVNEAVAAGAKILTGGKRDGVMFQPTVLSDVRPDMKVICEEIFAPVVSLVPYDNFDQALQMVEESKYGLQAGIFTKNVDKAFAAIKKLNVGGVIINDVPTFRADHMPYGGNKESGIGREGLKYAIEEMTNIKMVCFNL